MIKIKNANKYFNRNKNNQIHVINDTTLTFPSTGLVCLLGASGSGKTTLLNVIGGLDKIDNGTIYFKDYEIKGYKANKLDEIRNKHFGYIFQNYILLPDLTVYQNLELVLNMLNLSKEEIDERIDYALEAVGMLKYKKRKPTQLSGGQQQRIAIARALVKSPEVVIADEPTGNLDERNTTQIMNIIKKISKECLVILVTHERRLADFYGDRIIEVSDGKIISDSVVSNDGEFEELDNNNIYLGEFTKEELKSEDVSIRYFYEEDKKDLNLNIIFKNNTFYIESPNDNLKIKLLDKSSEIKVIDSKKPKIMKQDIDDFQYHLPKIENKDIKKDTVIGFKDTLKMAFRHLGSLRKREKLLFIVLFLSTIMITIGFINLFSASRVDESNFLYFNRNIITIDGDYNSFKDYVEDDLLLIEPDSLMVKYLNNGYFNQAKNNISTLNELNYNYTNSIIPIESLNKPNLILGKLPEKGNEVVIDKYLVDIFLESFGFSSAGIKYPEQLIGLTFNSTLSSYMKEDDFFTIVGIVNNNNPNFYITYNSYKNVVMESKVSNFGIHANINNFNDLDEKFYYKLDSNYNLLSESTPLSNLILKENQVILDYNAYLEFENLMKSRNTNIIDFGLDQKAEIIGVVKIEDKTNFNPNNIYLKDSFIDSYYKAYILKNDNFPKYVHSNNPNKLLKELNNNDNIKAKSLYDYEYDRLKVETFNIELFITSLIVLAGALIFLYFLMRSSMLSRIYQIGVYRALGIKKKNIYKMFFIEILVITLITSLIGISIVSFAINRVNSVMKLIHYPIYIPLLSFVFIFIVNVIVGLIPVNRLLRLTPSQILSKYDI